jgi:hypothetical protein
MDDLRSLVPELHELPDEAGMGSDVDTGFPSGTSYHLRDRVLTARTG